MRLYILLFGATAGLLGIFVSIVALALPTLHLLSGTGDGPDGTWLLTLALSALGLYGARHALAHPRLSSTVMASAAVGGVLSVAWFFALPALIFSIASTLGFLWRNENPSRPTGA